MLTHRDVATLTWYALLFSAIVLWASLRASDEVPNRARAMSPDTFSPAPAYRPDNLLEMRRTRNT